MSRLIYNYELPKQIYACSFDIFKAFDHVNLDMVNDLFEAKCNDIKVLAEWKNELEDLKRMNLDISGHVINRTRGILQGSELSPFIFNFITTCILKEIDNSDKVSSSILVYADNWIIINNDRIILSQEMVTILNIINRFGFIVQENDIHYFQFKNRCTTDKCENIMKNASRKEKILGVNFMFEDNYMEIDKESMKFNININYSTDPHTAILLIKKYYNPKFRYFADMLKIWDENEYDAYVEWYKNEIKRVFNRISVTLLVPNELIDNIVNNNMDRRTNYYWFYAADFKNDIPNDSFMIKRRLRRWKNLAKWLKEENQYLGIHTIFNFIMQEVTDDPYQYVKSYIDKNNLHRTYINLDIAYNAIISNQDMIAVMEYSQEIINENYAACIYDPIKNKVHNYYN